jgi:O-antigen/teichoic acid export membrane protein
MKESSGFYSSLGLLILLNAVIKPIWIFGIDRQVQNAVGTFEYGSYFALFNLSIVFSFLLDWGLTAWFNRHQAAQQNLVHSAGQFLLIKVLFSFLYVVIVLMAAYLARVDRWDIVWGVALIQVFSSLFLFFRSIITAEQWFRTDAWLSVLDKTLMIMLCGSLLFFPPVFGVMTINKFLWVQSSCTALAMISAGVVLLRRGIGFSMTTFSRFFTKKLLLGALPYGTIVLLMAVHFRIDGFLLERLHPAGSYETGTYAAAYRLLDAANMIGFLVASFLLPYVARQWHQQKDINGVILTVRHCLLGYATVVAMVAIFLAPWLQRLLYHHTDAYSIDVMAWCLPAIIGYSLTYIYGTVMTATGHIRALCLITAVAVVINVTLNLVYIPSMGAKACCLAALISQGTGAIAAMIYVKQKLKVPVHTGSLLINIFIAAVLFALLYWGDRWPVSKWGLVIAASMIAVLILIATRLFKPGEWMTSLKKSHL